MNKIIIEGGDLDSYVKTKLVFMAKGQGKTEKQIAIQLIDWAIRNEHQLLKAIQKGLVKAQ